jgi:FkbH-like protein
VNDRASAILQGADEGRLASAAAAVRALEAGGFAWRAHAKARVLRNFTAEPLAVPLKLAAFQRGVALDLSFSDYDAYAQEILDERSDLGADLVVLALSLDELRPAFTPSGEIDAEAVIDHLTPLIERLAARARGAVALSTFLMPLGRVGAASDDLALAKLNLAILSLAERHERVFVVDLRRFVEQLGEARAIDARGALAHRAPIAHPLAVLWARALADALARKHGAPRKVLALDCDGTLWGGVVGEDGPGGIQLDEHGYPGRAFVAFQEQILALSRRGALIALSSKNEDSDVMGVLSGHPSCRIRPEHVAARRINWASKVDNLRAIAEELHVGLDSFVFIDDSPYECAMVKEALPMVDVRRAPEHASDLCSLLRDAAPSFGGSIATAEDQRRTQSMHEEERRSEAQKAANDLDGFLGSLALVADVGPVDKGAIPRAAQLTQRTNQWNATTRRYDVEGVARLAASEGAIVLGMSAKDRFGDYGLIGVAIAIKERDYARLDTLLLSCRALGRRLEDVLLGEAMTEIERRWGPLPVLAEYIPTPKNAQVTRFFDGRGFACVEDSPGRRAYVATGARISPPHFITVRRREAA